MGLIYRIRKNRFYRYCPAFIRNILKKIYLKIFLRFLIWLKPSFKKSFAKINDNIIYVNPEKIIYANTAYKKDNIFESVGLIEGGGWDLKKIRFENLKIFKSLKDHFNSNIPLCETELYRSDINSNERNVKIGTGKWECITKDEYNGRVRKIDNLYSSIKEKGYKNQKALGSDNILDEIAIKIGRNGELLFQNSIHRLAIAKILKIKKVPVVVTVRHLEWMNFKRSLMNFAKSQPLGKLYQKLTHPDLEKIPYVYGDERFDIIKENLISKNGLVLDIGANLGSYCQKFEELGFDCYAVENNEILVNLMKKLRNIENKNFTIIKEDIFEWFIREGSFKKYSIILALNIFHHFLKTENNYYNFVKLLNNLDVDEMFFEPHRSAEKQMINAYKNYNNLEFIKFIIKNTSLTKYKKIGKAIDDRNIYHLT